MKLILKNPPEIELTPKDFNEIDLNKLKELRPVMSQEDFNNLARLKLQENLKRKRGRPRKYAA